MLVSTLPMFARDLKKASVLQRWLSDLRVLVHLLRGQSVSVADQRARLDAFYRPQAAHYDAFRHRLLCGREALVRDLQSELGNSLNGSHLVELGGGTGQSLEYFGERLQTFERVALVDLCPALLERAQEKFVDQPQVYLIEADATMWQPSEPADAVLFAYSLTMIPNWRAALENALSMLKPGGIIAVVDFYVSAANTPRDQVRHHALSCTFWRRWFAHDGVLLNPEHLATLRELCAEHEFSEARAPVPYLPGLAVPYYRFIGRRA